MGRWPPHINICWGFLCVEDVGKHYDTLERACSTMQPFQVTLAQLQVSEIGADRKAAVSGNSKVSIYLHPDSDSSLETLASNMIAAVDGIVGTTGGDGRTGPLHMTVGQVPYNAVEKQLRQ